MQSSIRPLPLFFVLVAACGTPVDDVVVDEVAPSALVFEAMHPEPWLELALDVDALVDAVPALSAVWSDESTACPSLQVTDTGWALTGDCAVDARVRVEGSLAFVEDDSGLRLIGEGFQIVEDSSTVLLFDGALESSRDGEILEVEAAVTACGGPAIDCDDGRTALDVSYGVFPVSGLPDVYDVTVTGVVAAPGYEPTSVDGAWSVDETLCETEPLTGTLLIAGDVAQALDFDGELACEGCATRSVGGFAAEPICELR